jgi:hypothetical protein
VHKANGHLPKAADRSTAKAQDQLRGLLWGDLIIYRQKKRHGQSVIEELERLRVKHGQDFLYLRGELSRLARSVNRYTIR